MKVSTLVKVNCCSNLLHGIQAEVNLLPGGNEGVRVPDSIGMLRQGSVYMVDCRFDDCSEGGKCLDDYASCELQKAKLVGSQKEFEKLVKRCTLSRTMKRLVEEMLTFNSEPLIANRWSLVRPSLRALRLDRFPQSRKPVQVFSCVRRAHVGINVRFDRRSFQC